MAHVLLLALMRYAPHQKVNTQNKNPTHQTIHINATKKKDNISMEMAWDKYIVPLNSFTNLHSEKVTNCYFRTNLF